MIVQPSFNPLVEGTDVSKGKILSPLIKKVFEFEVFVVGGEKVLNFGQLKNFYKLQSVR